MDQLKRDELYDQAAMRVILQPLVEEELAEFDAYNQIPHEYSAKFMDRLRGIFRRDSIKRGVRKTLLYARKVFVCVSVAFVLLLAACSAVKPIRDRVADAFVTWYEKYAGISYTVGETISSLKQPTVIPEGYVETERYEDEDEMFLYIVYTNDEGNRLIFEREENYEGYEFYVDRNHVNMLEIDFNGTDAIYLEPQREGDTYSLIWQEGNMIYFIHADESKEIMLEFAGSAK